MELYFPSSFRATRALALSVRVIGKAKFQPYYHQSRRTELVFYGKGLFFPYRYYSSSKEENQQLANNSLPQTSQLPPTSQHELTDKSPDTKKPTLWEQAKETLKHYWKSSVILAQETKISSKLLYKLVKGGTLIRSERLQLSRSFADLIRLVPFSVFVIVPGLELALPFFLKFFPNMLPSTFETPLENEKKKASIEASQIQVSQLLHSLLEEVYLKQRLTHVDSSSVLSSAPASSSPSSPPPNSLGNGIVINKLFKLFKEYRVTGQTIATEDLVKFSKEELSPSSDGVLSKLSGKQLRLLCRYMGIKDTGRPERFLQFRLALLLNKIAKDDVYIEKEGVDSLKPGELRQACSQRGIKLSGSSTEQLKAELQQWLDLHIIHKMPLLLLVTTRALIMADKQQVSKAEA